MHNCLLGHFACSRTPHVAQGLECWHATHLASHTHTDPHAHINSTRVSGITHHHLQSIRTTTHVRLYGLQPTGLAQSPGPPGRHTAHCTQSFSNLNCRCTSACGLQCCISAVSPLSGFSCSLTAEYHCTTALSPDSCRTLAGTLVLGPLVLRGQ